ncbi:hypothetical protein DL546_003141 [Coniochaeta pulveracea]|uniref:F-box domain-containing protein n=1 Tax=Coniochaeta pulveracea TaxID=177199 RepID=A0A420YKQ7_9PEZI|nr:hypothetical protein DL546_003141 [Coniochaeta pulveracea]
MARPPGSESSFATCSELEAGRMEEQPGGLLSFPTEVLLLVMSYLEAHDIAHLQLVCRTLLQIGRDDSRWKDLCFETSSLYHKNFLDFLVSQDEAASKSSNVHHHLPQAHNALPQAPMQPLATTLPPTFTAVTPPNPLLPLQNQVALAGPDVLYGGLLQGNLPPGHTGHALTFQLPLGGPQDSLQPTGQDASPITVQDLTLDSEPELSDDEVTQKVLVRSRQSERARFFANWDPTYPGEEVCWYGEYIHRTAPTVVSWFEQPYHEAGKSHIEARGAALYRPDAPTNDTGQTETLLAIAPLDDGSICIWDVNGTRVGKGSILAKSKPGILFIDGPAADNSRASKRVDSGVTECVSVDNQRHRAFFAVQSHLIDVDLQQLSVVGCESFPWSITALSPAHPAVPLTIATSLGIHLYDYKEGRSAPEDHTERVDGFSTIGAQFYYEQNIKSLFSDVPLPPYAALAQPGPLSILHLQKPGSWIDLSDDIFVAGRFSNILQYDRRKFPAIKCSIWSGGSLCSMTGSPYPFAAEAYRARRRGELTSEEVATSKELSGGRTLIACGEYNQKGSLELYGLSPPSEAKTETAEFKNRFAASGSKLLSVVSHGTCIAVSDAQGYIKWFERDGCTEIRRSKIGHHEVEGGQTGNMFASMSSADDLARKILPTKEGSTGVNDNDLLFWTGENLGLVGFGIEPSVDGSDNDSNAERTARQIIEDNDDMEDQYREFMRLGLYHNAQNGAWFFRGRSTLDDTL